MGERLDKPCFFIHPGFMPNMMLLLLLLYIYIYIYFFFNFSSNMESQFILSKETNTVNIEEKKNNTATLVYIVIEILRII